MIATIIAAVVARQGYKEYLQSPEQEAEPDDAVAEVAAADDAGDLLVFKTSKQKTNLAVVGNRIECHLEDVRPNRGGHQWTLGSEELSRILKTGDVAVNPGYRARTGLFSIGPRRNWLYSKQLFPEPEYLHGALTDLIKRAVRGG